MKFKFLLIASFSSALVASGFAHSALITHGDLTSDDTTDIIINTVTGVEYLRLDTFQMTYAETLAAVASGGIYDGWAVADSIASDAFINGLLGGTSACDGAVAFFTTCGIVTGWVDGDFGLAYDNMGDLYAYISTLTTPGITAQEVGVGWLYGDGILYDTDDIMRYTDADSHSSINFLLYRDNLMVTEPSSLAVFALGMIGLSIRRFKKQS